MKTKRLAIMIAAFALGVLTFLGGTTAGSLALIPSQESSQGDTTQAVAWFNEEVKVVAGIDNAAFVQLSFEGGSDINPVASSDLSSADAWIFAMGNQSEFIGRLLRRPLPFPDGATLLLNLPTNDITTALAVANDFNTHYGIGLLWASYYILPDGGHVFLFNSQAEADAINQFGADVAASLKSGYSDCFSASAYDAAIVKLSLIGGYDAVPFAIISYVDDNGVVGDTTAGTDLSVSTGDMFGGLAEAATGAGYSAVKFRFPYTITPTSISPRAHNVAPQLTGRMDWYSRGFGFVMGAVDYNVEFTTSFSQYATAPNVQVQTEYDPLLMQSGGELRVDYNVTNIGQSDAHNVTIGYHIGQLADFMDEINNVQLPKMKDDLIIDETHTAGFNLTVTVETTGAYPSSDSETWHILDVDGWYHNTTSDTTFDWDYSFTELDIASFSQSYNILGFTGDVITTVTLEGDNGISEIALATMTEVLEYAQPTIPTGETSPAAILENVIGQMEDYAWYAVGTAAKALYLAVYVNTTLLNWDEASDFVLDGGMVKAFIEGPIAPGESVYVDWGLLDVPSEGQRFATINFHQAAPGEAVQMVTEEYDFLDVMRFLLAALESEFGQGTITSGRFVSHLKEFHGEDYWVSGGARFHYQDDNGFGYFGFGNGVNYQFGDNNPAIKATVAMNQLSYTVGDNVEITVRVENTVNSTGMTPEEITAYTATDMGVHLIHGRLGHDWNMEDPQWFAYVPVGDLAPGEVFTEVVTVVGNSFLGAHPIVAAVEFTSDAGEGAYEAFNPFWDMSFDWEAAGEAKELVYSTMTVGLLLPDHEATRPSFPQPVLDVETTVDINTAVYPWQVTVRYEVTNVGDDDTYLSMYQLVDTNIWSKLDFVSSQGATTEETIGDMLFLVATNIHLDVAESFTFTVVLEVATDGDVYLAPARIVYTYAFENELGEGDPGDGGGGASSKLNALVKRQEDDESGGSWEAYTESTSVVGAKVNAPKTQESSVTRNKGFLGGSELLLMPLAAYIALVVYRRRKA